MSTQTEELCKIKETLLKSLESEKKRLELEKAVPNFVDSDAVKAYEYNIEGYQNSIKIIEAIIQQNERNQNV
jgi:hypothetical protein